MSNNFVEDDVMQTCENKDQFKISTYFSVSKQVYLTRKIQGKLVVIENKLYLNSNLMLFTYVLLHQIKYFLIKIFYF
jgi:hypothetical protein